MAYTTINKSTDYFNTKLYTGNGGTNAITGVGFQPDWVWIKNRDDSYNNALFDAVRGVTKFLASNNSDAEQTNANELTAFGTDGFTSGNADRTNKNSDSFVSWNWKANGAGSANTAGSINSTVSVNTTAGFSVVKYVGSSTNPSTVGHGLGTAPSMIIVKNTSTSGRDWVIWHKALGGASSTADLLLFTTDAKITSSGYWGSSAPSSTTFGVGNTNNNNANGNNHIAYCFAEKTGYSKFGSYTGNGNADGTFIYTGFKPAFLMVKCTSNSGESWLMQDSKRIGYNGITQGLLANSNSAEASETYQEVDFLSNGFKWKGTDTRVNANGYSYIYMAFAEAPLVGTNNVPANAR
jgi:hypothetical protein